ncbi:MAG: hypothetical protein D3914_15970 [Candidatus Electrothrix sp. LOE2]|nr:hypothetical protein [Candidatus Electrothrix sp. LOE2]
MALFTAMKKRKEIYRTVWFLSSLFLLFLAFLIKETVIITSVTLAVITLLIFYENRILVNSIRSKSNLIFLVVTLVFSIICSIIVCFIVLKYRQGYTDGYSVGEYDNIQKSLEALWVWLSAYSLHHLYGYIPILFFTAVAIKERKKALHNIPIMQHASLLAVLLLFCYGFLFILIPWKPLGFKYVLPSVFFFSFAVALSLSLLAAWAKERYGRRGLLVYFTLFVYIILYYSYLEKSNQEKVYWAELGNYGASVAAPLADSIADEVFFSSTKKQRIFLNYGTNVSWANDIPFGWLHLMRILNLEKKINLMDQNGREILNYHMPTAELSSFRKYKNKVVALLSVAITLSDAYLSVYEIVTAERRK